MRSSGSVRRKAEAAREPIRLRVNMPVKTDVSQGFRRDVSRKGKQKLRLGKSKTDHMR